MIECSSSRTRRYLLLLGALVLAASVVAPAIAAGQTAEATASDEDASVVLSSDELEGATLHGQRLTVGNLSAFDDGTVDLRRYNASEGEHRQFATVDPEAGSVTLDTRNLPAGSYLYRDATGEHGPFEVVRHDLTASASNVADDETVQLVLESNNRNESIDLVLDTMNAFDWNATIEGSLDDAVGGDAVEATLEQETRLRLHDVRVGQQVAIDVGAFEPGTYSLLVRGADSRAYDDVEFSVPTDGVDVETDGSGLGDATLWGGQTVALENLTPREDGTVALLASPAEGERRAVREFDVDDGGGPTLHTHDLDAGSYVFRDGSGELGPFEIREQTLEASFDPSTFEVHSNRAAYDLRFDASGIEAETFAAAFDRGELRDGSFLLPVEDGSASVDVAASELPAGEHEVAVSVDDVDGATVASSLTVVDRPTTGGQFVADTANASIGDVASFELATDGHSETLWLTLRDQSSAYEATVALTEIDHSDQLTVEWDTHQARNVSEAGLHVDGASVANVTVEGPEGPSHLPNATEGRTVTVAAHVSDAAAAAGNATDELALRLESLDVGDLTTYTAPGPRAHDHDHPLEAILADATERDTVVNRDLLIARVNASGVFGSLNASPAGLSQNGLGFEIVERSGGDDGFSRSLSEYEGHATVVERPADDAIYVVIDAVAISSVAARHSLEARFSIDGADNAYVSDDGPGADVVANDSVSYEGRRVEIGGEFVGDRLLVPTNQTASITGETNVAPGTEFQLRADLPDDVRLSSGTVTENGTVTGTVYLAHVEAGTEIEPVRIRVPDLYTEATVDAVTYDPDDGAAFLAAEAPSNGTLGETVTLDVGVTNPGETAISTPVAVTVDGERIANRSRTIGPGETVTVRHEVVPDDVGVLDWRVETSDDAASGEVTVGDGVELDGFRPLPVDDSGIHYDVNGDGTVSASDVVTFFHHQHTPAWNERPDLFDFDGNGDVGQSDVVELFEYVAGQDVLG